MQIGKKHPNCFKGWTEKPFSGLKVSGIQVPSPQDNTPDQLKQTHHPHTLGRTQRTTVHFVFC